MSWFRADDTLSFNPKVVIAGNAAIGLWVRAGAWSASQLTDGFVPSAIARAMAGEMAEVSALVSAGMWDEVDGGYRFHDWSEYQVSSEDVKAKRKAKSEAGKRGAASRWHGTSHSSRHGTSHSSRHGKRDDETMLPSHPLNTSSELRPEVESLLNHLDGELTDAAVMRVPQRTKKNRDSARLLLDADKVDLDEAKRVITWATHDSFWSSNIGSMVKFREKYPTLKAQMGATKPKSSADEDAERRDAQWRAPKPLPEEIFGPQDTP